MGLRWIVENITGHRVCENGPLQTDAFTPGFSLVSFGLTFRWFFGIIKIGYRYSSYKLQRFTHI